MGLSEVTLTLVDPEIVEAAKFVLEGGADDTHGPIAVPDSAYGAMERAFNIENTEFGAEEGGNTSENTTGQTRLRVFTMNRIPEEKARG